MDWSQFWQNAGANALGSLIGVAAALWGDRRADASKRARQREDEDRRRERREAAQWRIAHWLVEENVELAKQAIDAVDADKRFVFPTNAHLLNVAISELATLTDASTTLYHLEHFRYQLLHVDEKVKERNAVGIQRFDTNEWRIFVGRVTESLRANLDTVVTAGEALLPNIRTEAQRVARDQLPFVRPNAITGVSKRPLIE